MAGSPIASSLGRILGIERRCDDVIDRQFEPEAALFRAPLDVPRGIHQLGLDERLADRHPARLEKRVRHRAADEQRVDAGYQVLDDLELVRHLRAAEDGHERPLGTLEHAAEILDFLRHQQSGRRLRDVMDNPFCGGVRAVRRAEGVVDVHVGERGELAGEVGVVLLLFRMEAQVFEQHDTARTGLLDRARRAGSPMASSAKTTGRPSSSASRSATGFSEYSGLGLPFGRPEVGRQNDGCAPCSSACWIVGSDARMRVSSPIFPFLIGTLKSTRMKTRLPSRSRSSIAGAFTTGPSWKGSAAGPRSGSSSPTRCRTTTGP